MKKERQQSEQQVTHARAMSNEYGPELFSALEPDNVLTSKQEKQLKDADTNNKKERLQKQTSSAVVQSTVFTSH